MSVKVEIFGVGVDVIDRDGVLDAIRSALAAHRRLLVTNVHVKGLNVAYETPWLRKFWNQADIVYCDGAGVQLGLRLLGRELPARVTLADWMEELMAAAAQTDAGVYFLGNPPGVARRAGERLAVEVPGLRFVGAHTGFFDRTPGGVEDEAVIADINGSGAELLLVGMGMPIQEDWIASRLDRLKPAVIMAVGGVFEYWGGDLVRAPRWMHEHGLEWLALTLQSPRRYWRRHLIGNPLFIFRVLRQRLTGRQFASPASG